MAVIERSYLHVCYCGDVQENLRNAGLSNTNYGANINKIVIKLFGDLFPVSGRLFREGHSQVAENHFFPVANQLINNKIDQVRHYI